MKYFLALILLVTLSNGARAAEELLLDGSSDANRQLNTFLRDQFIQKAKDLKESQEEAYKRLLEKYPDLGISPVQSFPSTAHLHMTYDRDFANTIFFAPSSSYLTDVQEEKLLSILETMREEPTFNLVVVGHASFNTQIEDLEKRFSYNQWISGRRAVNVWNFFVKNGILETRLAAFTRGSTEPLNGEESASEINMNRRVELRLTNQPIQLGSSRNSTAASQRSTSQRNQPAN